MSDSGLPQLPPGGRHFDPATVQSKSEYTVKIESVRGDLRDVGRATRVEGEVTQITRDGTATLRIAEGGEIDIQIRGRVTLRQHQKIEIDLPAGSPPRQAVIRALPETPAQKTQPPATPPPPEISQPDARIPLLPVAIPPEMRAILDDMIPLTQPASSPRAIPVPQPVPIQPDAILHLIPLSAFPPASAMLPPPPLQPASPLPAATLSPPLQLARISTAGLQGTLSGNPLKSALPAVTTLNPVPGVHPSLANTPSPQAILQPLSLPPDTPLSPLTTVLTTTIPGGNLLQRSPLILPAAIKTPAPLMFPVPPASGVLPPHRFDVRIAAITPPQIIALAAPVGQPASSPATLHASVSGITPRHYPVLSVFQPGQAEGTPYLLQFPTSMLPVGTQVELLPQAVMPSAATMSAAPFFPFAMPALAIDLLSGWVWPVFDDALEIMTTQFATSQATNMVPSLAQILPNPANPAQMSSAILFFVAAVRAGDVGGWMGERALNALKREGSRGGNILEKLTRDFSDLSRMLSEPVSQDWRGLSIPYLWQNEVQKMNLYFRHQNGDDPESPDDKKGRSTRFIFDLHLDRMGDVQLDGLMKGPRLDLILRTQTPFAQTMQALMRQKYLDILGTGHLLGDLAFQTRKDQWVRVDARQGNLKTTA